MHIYFVLRFNVTRAYIFHYMCLRVCVCMCAFMLVKKIRHVDPFSRKKDIVPFSKIIVAFRGNLYLALEEISILCQSIIHI